MCDGSADYGPVEWAVVTGRIAPSVLFVRLEASDEKAFLNITDIHDNNLCSSPEYWPDAGERIRVRRLDSERRRIRVTRRESVLEGLVRGFPTRHFAMPPGLGPIERAVVVSRREEDLLVRLVESGRECTLPADFLSHYQAECAKEHWPAVGKRLRVRRLGVWLGGEDSSPLLIKRVVHDIAEVKEIEDVEAESILQKNAEKILTAANIDYRTV